MPSRVDTLVLALQALNEARGTLHDAADTVRTGRRTVGVEPPVLVLRAVLVLEHQAARLRRSFNLPTE